MKLRVKVKTGKREVRVLQQTDGSYVVEVVARREKGRANKAILKALAGHLNFATSRLNIISGITSASKVIEIV